MASKQGMIHTIIFSTVMFVLAYLIYVLPFFLMHALFTKNDVFNPAAIFPTSVVFVLLRLYVTKGLTNKVLKGFIYYGMGVGLLALMSLLVMMSVGSALSLDGNVAGWLAIGTLAALTAYCIFNAKRIAVKKLTLTSDKLTEIRHLAFISDVHVGSNPPGHLKRICDQLRKLKFNSLLIAGDLFDSSDFHFEDIAALGTIDTDIYFVTGNHEGYVKGFETQLARFHELNIRVLENEASDLDGINLIGISDQQSILARSEAVERLYRSDSYNIVLVHQPSIWDKTRNKVDLMLCGHTHNGQIFPFSLIVRLHFRYVYGLFNNGASSLYVSSGAGCWGPRMRLGSRNEIVLVELRPV